MLCASKGSPTIIEDMENANHKEICDLRERLARAEEKIEAADKALILAKESVSKTNLGAVATFVLSVLAMAIAWLKK